MMKLVCAPVNVLSLFPQVTLVQGDPAPGRQAIHNFNDPVPGRGKAPYSDDPVPGRRMAHHVCDPVPERQTLKDDLVPGHPGRGPFIIDDEDDEDGKRSWEDVAELAQQHSDQR